MPLTTRNYELLRMIADHGGYQTTADLALALGFSRRTILRELQELLTALGPDARFIKRKSGQGVSFTGNESEREALLARHSKKGALLPSYTPDERLRALLVILLSTDESLKIYTLTRELGVTEATVSLDLNRCEAWLAESGIKLIRKPGVGVYLTADEYQRRRALIRVYYHEQNENQGRLFNREPALIKGINPSYFMKLRQILRGIEGNEELFRSDRARDALCVHLYLILKRVQSKGFLSQTAEADREDEAYLMALHILGEMERAFDLKIPPGEAQYLSSVLRSAQGMLPFTKDTEQAERLCRQICALLETQNGILIDPEGAFAQALTRHLLPTLERIKQGLEIRNPMLEDIKANSGELYRLSQSCCSLISREIGLPVPETEVGHIAMHLGVAIEDSLSRQPFHCRVAVCCPSGLVSAQLLSLKLKREFPELVLTSVGSTVELDYERLINEGVEMIISTVPLPDAPLPCATVSPFLSAPEKESVWQLLQSFRNRTSPQVSEPLDRSGDFANRLNRNKELSEAILQILNGFYLWDLEEGCSLDCLVESVSSHLAKGLEDRKALKKDLLRRESLGSTVIERLGLMLLHCRSNGIKRLSLGIARFKSPLAPAKTALIMLAPLQTSSLNLEALACISKAVVENEDFAQTLLSGSYSLCLSQVEALLQAFYRETLQNNTLN